MKALFSHPDQKLRISRTAVPSFMAQVRAGIIRPKTGVDWLLFGVVR